MLKLVHGDVTTMKSELEMSLLPHALSSLLFTTTNMNQLSDSIFKSQGYYRLGTAIAIRGS